MSSSSFFLLKLGRESRGVEARKRDQSPVIIIPRLCGGSHANELLLLPAKPRLLLLPHTDAILRNADAMAIALYM